MSTKSNEEIIKKSKLEEVLRTEVDFYDRLGNHAVLTKVVYRDKKGKFSEQVIRVKWISFIDNKKMTYITSVSVAVNKCSNGIFFLTVVKNNHGEVLNRNLWKMFFLMLMKLRLSIIRNLNRLQTINGLQKLKSNKLTQILKTCCNTTYMLIIAYFGRLFYLI